jgi:hypothetical protein
MDSYSRYCKGVAWLDFDNDGYQDLFLNYQTDQENCQLYRNNHDRTFTEVDGTMGIQRPATGFSCWAWDYDNDGWQDIFATCYRRTLTDVVKGLQGEPHSQPISKCLVGSQFRCPSDDQRKRRVSSTFQVVTKRM